jgi:small subunit ribosomal protein S6
VGKRRLAYPIKKFEEAFYVLFHYEGESEIPTELERRFKQTEAIIRFLTVREEASETRCRKKAKATSKKKQEVPEERREREAQQKSSSDKLEEEAKEE